MQPDHFRRSNQGKKLLQDQRNVSMEGMHDVLLIEYGLARAVSEA